MKKLRFLSLVLALLMIFTMFVGCSSKENTDGTVDNSVNTQSTTDAGNNDATEPDIEEDTSNKGYITSKDSFVNKMAELLDISLYKELEESDYTSFKSYYYSLDYENKMEYDLDYKIGLGDGSEFTMPITFNELEKEGWFLQDSSSPDRDLDAGYMSYGIVENASGKTLSVSAYNPTDKTITFKECTVIQVQAQQYSTLDPAEKLSEAIDFTVCGSLTNASNLEDIINKLGNPYSINCTLHFDDNGKYTYSDIEINYMQRSSAYSSLVFELSGDDNYITNIHYDVEPK